MREHSMQKNSIWVVISSRQGVQQPIEYNVSKVVENVAVDESPSGDKIYSHLYELGSPQCSSEVTIRNDMSYLKVDEYQNDDETGLWLNSSFYAFNEDDAKDYYEREFKRFEHLFGKHRYFKILSGDHVGMIFIETDYNGIMHYARILGEKYMIRLLPNECVEVMDYNGISFPKPLTGYHDHINLTCPECHEEIDPPDWMSDGNRIYKVDCPHCKLGFEVALNIEVTYSASTDIDKFLGGIEI